MPLVLSKAHRTTQGGYGLLEIALVFILVIAASGVLFALYHDAAKPTYDISTEVAHLRLIRANLESVAYLHKPGNWSAVVAESKTPVLHIYPPEMQPPDSPYTSTGWGTSVWGNMVVILPNPSAVPGNPACRKPNTCYSITYINVPLDECQRFVRVAAPFFPDGIIVSPEVQVIDVSTGKINEPTLNMICQGDAAGVTSISFFVH